MSDSIFAQEFCKQFVFKMASLINDACSRVSISSQDVSLNKSHYNISIIYGISYSFHSFGYIIHSKENIEISK